MLVPKLIVFDVDGTLVPWDGEVSTATMDALGKVRASEVAMALATGRPQAIAPHTLAQVGGADWMVCGNGSSLFEVASGAMIRETVVPPEVVEPLVRGMRETLPGVGFAVEVGHVLLEEPGFARRVPEDPTEEPVADILEAFDPMAGGVRRIIAYHDDYDERLGELATMLQRYVVEGCQVQYMGLPIVDVSPAGDNKSAALAALVDHLGLTPRDVMAFGDGSNDIEMLQWAGTGVAMGNASPVVQQAADMVTAHIDDGGIAHVISQLFDR